MIAKLILYGAILAAIAGLLGALHHSIYASGVNDAKAANLAQIRKDCGDTAKVPRDCYDAGIASVKAEFAGKIDAANGIIASQNAALETANAAVTRLKTDSQKRSNAAAAAVAEVESRAQFAADQLAKVLNAKPTGTTPCESACLLLRSPW